VANELILIVEDKLGRSLRVRTQMK
jgi:hypothetical protein